MAGYQTATVRLLRVSKNGTASVTIKLKAVKAKDEKKLGMLQVPACPSIMACGKAVVCSSGAGASELIATGVNGIVVPPGDPGRLAEIKRLTGLLEAEFAAPGLPPRPVNIDPGFVDEARLVLATAKDRGHRLYLGQGVYAEVTLSFSGGQFTPLPWTYPDYASAEYREFFAGVRERLREQRRAALFTPPSPPAPASPACLLSPPRRPPAGSRPGGARRGSSAPPPRGPGSSRRSSPAREAR